MQSVRWTVLLGVPLSPRCHRAHADRNMLIVAMVDDAFATGWMASPGLLANRSSTRVNTWVNWARRLRSALWEVSTAEQHPHKVFALNLRYLFYAQSSRLCLANLFSW